LDLVIDGVANIIKKGFKAGITVAFGGLFGSLCELGQEGQDLIRSDTFEFIVTEFILEPVKDKLIIF
jgi:hypothetical protein